MELCEIAISLEDIKQIQSELYRLFIVISECSGDSSEQGLVL